MYAPCRGGTRAEHLPPYSPDFNPIEMAWSKLQSHLHKAATRTIKALNVVVAADLQPSLPKTPEAGPNTAVSKAKRN